MRTDIRDRYYRVCTYQAVDRVPDIEFGYWPQTIRRWLKEGMPLELTPQETQQMFPRKLDDFFGFEHEGVEINLRLVMKPPFEERLLERRSGTVISQDAEGITAERFLNDVDDSSIPHFLKFPVETPEDWSRMKERYRLGDPIRFVAPEDIDHVRSAMGEGKMVSCWGCGFYGALRNWMGFENLSMAFYEYPGMIHEMVGHWAELVAQQIESLPVDIPIDHMGWWEDMAGKNGPFVGPAMFREFIQPGYHRVMSAVKKRGCTLSTVDSDGNPRVIVANWLEEGVNTMFPLEIEAGVDPLAWRREFGRDLRLRGGIAKQPLVEGGLAIDRELERLRPLLEDGGYIPGLDHLVPPDVPYAHYCDYLEKKRKLIEKC